MSKDASANMKPMRIKWIDYITIYSYKTNTQIRVELVTFDDISNSVGDYRLNDASDVIPHYRNT